MAAQPASQLWRYDINMTDGTHTERCLGERMLDFPSVHPAFLGQSGCTQALLHADLLHAVSSCRHAFMSDELLMGHLASWHRMHELQATLPAGTQVLCMHEWSDICMHMLSLPWVEL